MQIIAHRHQYDEVTQNVDVLATFRWCFVEHLKYFSQSFRKKTRAEPSNTCRIPNESPQGCIDFFVQKQVNLQDSTRVLRK